MSEKYLLKDFTLPKNISKTEEIIDKSKAVVSIDTFERGAATTIGNSIRRVLLSSIQGFAVVAAKITIFDKDGGQKHVASEYGVIENIKEDTIDVLDAIKKMKIIVDDEEKTKVSLQGRCVGVNEFTLSVFQTSGITITNANDVLLTSTSEVDILIELEVELGRGYVSAEEIEKRIQIEDTIPLDVVFSPVINVFYEVENVRVGHRSDYEKLNLTVQTDGTITPVDVVAQAAKLIKDMVTPLINFDEMLVDTIENVDTQMTKLDEKLNVSIDDLELSQRSSNCFKAASIITLRDLVKMPERDVDSLPNFGKKCMDEVKEKLKELDLTFGMDVS